MPAFNDPLYSAQWHLNNLAASPIDLNILPVWEDYTGAGVRVGVQEGGAVQYSHPDLAGNYNHSIDYDGPSQSGSISTTTFFQHATAVAGVIGASANNGLGGIGVAYDVDLASYQIANQINADGSFGLDWNDLGRSFNAAVANNIDVLNNSWGSTSIYGINFNSGFLASTATAIGNAVANGRSGLGINIVWSAGNSRQSPDWSNSTNFANSPYTIAVGAVGEDREYSYYSSPGSNLLISAPSNGGGRGITTTDLSGSAGYSSNDYTSLFGGTSSAAPKVSGVVALMLEANADLGYRDVQDILAYSARREILETPTGSETDWVFNGAKDWNGGGLHHNNDYGLGLVDATAAVRLAETWQAQSTRANETVVSQTSASTAQIVNGLSVVSQTINIAADVELEYVQLAVDMTHSYSGDVILRLISPSGTVSTLKEGDGFTEGASVDWPGNTFVLSSTAFWGENSAGTWRLEVHDSEPVFDNGTFRGFTLTVRGTTSDDNDTYVFTDEFGTYGAGDANRRTLSDTSGSDILNAAAVTGAQSIDLRAGSISSIAGQSLAISAGTLIETAFAGDGADTLVGNEAANLLHGGRGNDTLTGGAGTDTLRGGRGDDSYMLSTLADSVEEKSGQGTDLVDIALSYTLGSNVEQLRLTGTDNIDGTGNSLANTLTGNTGNNILDGQSGADTLAGGFGDDTYIIDDVGDRITELANAGVDTVLATASHVLATNVDHLQLLGAGNLSGSGNSLDNSMQGNSGDNSLSGFAGDDTLAGGAGDDTLDGGTGADTLTGGLDDDTYVIDDAGDSIVENAAEGNDTVRSYLDHTLQANLENLQLLGAADLTGNGNNSANVLTGNTGNNGLSGMAGNDTLDGGAGADTLSGGLDDDTYVIDNVGDSIVEAAGEGTDSVQSTIDHTLQAAVENLLLLGNGALSGTGNGLDNIITGSGGNNALVGLGGNDTLDGGSGADTLTGGSGDDIYLVGDANDVIIESAAEGTDTAQTSVDYTLQANVEDLQILGVSDLDGSGNQSANRLTGNSGRNLLSGLDGNDTLDGGSGLDTLAGGADDDVYLVRDAGTRIVEAAGEGLDRADVHIADFTLSENLEQGAIQIQTDARLIGNRSDNLLTGNDGNDTLGGEGGQDTLRGGDGNDVLTSISTTTTAALRNASFDNVPLPESAPGVENTRLPVIPGWDTRQAYGKNPADSQIATDTPGENVLAFYGFSHQAQQTLSETFDKSARYSIAFDHGKESGLAAGVLRAELHVDGVLVGQLTSDAPSEGWVSRSFSFNGSSFPALDGKSVTLTFTGVNTRSSTLLNNVAITKSYQGSDAPRVVHDIAIENASFDDPGFGEGSGQNGSNGWITNSAGTWNPAGASAVTPIAGENVLWMHGGGARASQTLDESFDSRGQYIFSFSHGTRSDYSGGEITAQIYAGDVLIDSLVSTAPQSVFTTPDQYWETRTLVVNGADYVAQDGKAVSIVFTRSGATFGQAQINDVRLKKELDAGVDPDRFDPVHINNASFDDIGFGNGSGQAGAIGWTTIDAGTWNPVGGAIQTAVPDENVLWMHNGNSSVSQVLTETFDQNAKYRLNFDHGTRADYSGGEITAQFHAGGVLIGTITSSAPAGGWTTRTIAFNGADFAGSDGQIVTISFNRTGNPNGQAQLNKIALLKEYAAGFSEKNAFELEIANASFDIALFGEGGGQNGVAGWATDNAGIWNPVDSAIRTNAVGETVLWMHDAGASASQTLSETFDTNARYVFSFDHGTRADYPGGEITAEIRAGGVLVGTVTSAAPANGWQTRTIIIDGADYPGQDGLPLDISFVRTGNPNGQAQLNNVGVIKEYAAGFVPKTTIDIDIANGSFDADLFGEGGGRTGASGWATDSAGSWNPIDSAIQTNATGETVLWMHDAGASASQTLTETFDALARYIFTFDHGTRADYPGGEITAEIRAGGIVIGTVTSTAPTSGWESRTIVINGADYAARDGQSLDIRFIRTGNPSGQAQLNNIGLVKEYAAGVIPKTVEEVNISNGSFDAVALGEGSGTSGAAGWTTNSAGSWNPTDTSIQTIVSGEAILWLHDAGAGASQTLTETFDTRARYNFTFDHGTRSDYSGGEITAEIRAGGIVIGTVTSTAPANGWETRTIVVNGADYAAQDSQSLDIRFIRTGAPNGQAQLNNIDLVKEYAAGVTPRATDDVVVANGSFDDAGLGEGRGLTGASGWITNSAGTWNPRDESIQTKSPGENVLWMHDAGASANQTLSETFDSQAVYVFTFDHGTRSDYPGGEITAEIRAGGVIVGTTISTAPVNGWETRAIIVNGADYAAQDDQSLEIHFTRTGNPNGQAQLNNVSLSKETVPVLGGSGTSDPADELFGDAGDDQLLSGPGNDTLSGGTGNDTLNGGQGNDLLTGGIEDDTFIFKRGDGLDVIADFSLIETDTIQLSGYSVDAFAALVDLISDVGGDALITFDDLNVITLKNTAKDDLDTDDFLFL